MPAQLARVYCGFGRGPGMADIVPWYLLRSPNTTSCSKVLSTPLPDGMMVYGTVQVYTESGVGGSATSDGVLIDGSAPEMTAVWVQREPCGADAAQPDDQSHVLDTAGANAQVYVCWLSHDPHVPRLGL